VISGKAEMSGLDWFQFVMVQPMREAWEARVGATRLVLTRQHGQDLWRFTVEVPCVGIFQSTGAHGRAATGRQACAAAAVEMLHRIAPVQGRRSAA
jgi:hypothetical protein